MQYLRLLTILLVGTVLITGCNNEPATVEAPTTTPAVDSNPATKEEVKTEEVTQQESDNADATGDEVANESNPAQEEIVIDVRTKEEWDKGHLEQAILIPHGEITEKIASVTEDKSAKLVLY